MSDECCSESSSAIASDWSPIELHISGGKNWMKEFQFSKSLNKTKCIICNKQFNGCFPHNWKRHICNNHHSQAKMYDVSIKRKHRDDELKVLSKKQKDGKLSRGDYIKNCVLMAAVNMTAFLLFNSPFFRALTFVHSVTAKCIVNSATIRYFIELTASAIRKLISLEIRNRLISIKIDIATRHHRSMLGVNIQFYCHLRRKIAIRTLGCIELSRSHKSSYLEQKIYEILALYDIDRKNVYSYTSDNGSNMLCLGKLIRRMQHDLYLAQQWEQFKEQTSNENEEMDDNMEPDDDVEFEFELQQNNHAQIDDETTESLMKSLTSGIYESPLALMVIFGCAAHTLQLAVHDVLGIIAKTNIKRIRSVIKELRSSAYLAYKPEGFKSLKLNVCSRWNSLYKMFESILKNRDQLTNLFARVPAKFLDDIKLSPNEFQYMSEFNEAFKPVFELTLALQSEQLAMSDVLLLWYRCKRDIGELDRDKNQFVVPLVEAFDARTEQLMENPLLATAVYIDPRLNHKKSSDFLGDFKELAEKRLLSVVKRIKENKVGRNEPCISSRVNLSSDEDEFERYIEFEVSKTALRVQDRPIDDKELLEQIKRLGLQDKIKAKSNIFAYYEDLKRKHLIDEDLFEAVMVVLAAPATQVSVERAFSALALLMDDNRCNLKSSTIDDILIIGLNRELTHLVDFETMPAPNSDQSK